MYFLINFKLNTDDNPIINILTKNLKEIIKSDSASHTNSFELKKLIPFNLTKYYRYAKL